MKTTFVSILFCFLAAGTATAQNWSFGAGTGPFVFGDFVRRTLQIGNEGGTGEQTTRLSAATRVGVAADIERSLSPYFAIRIEGTFTRAPLAIKGSTTEGVSLDAGKLNVATVMVPLVVRFNPRGTFRFHVMGGPAYAMYDISAQTNSVHTFIGRRSRWGAALGGGVGWYFTEHFGLEGQLTDITTTSPFNRADFPAGFGRVKIPRPHNIHTTAGIRYRF